MLLGEPPAHWILSLLSKVDILLLLKGGGEEEGERKARRREEGDGREKGKRRGYEM